MMKKNKYTITFEFIGHHTVEIEADTIENAVEKGKNWEARHDHSDLNQTECLVIGITSEDGEEHYE